MVLEVIVRSRGARKVREVCTNSFPTLLTNKGLDGAELQQKANVFTGSILTRIAS